MQAAADESYVWTQIRGVYLYDDSLRSTLIELLIGFGNVSVGSRLAIKRRR
jgi:hypothetical protein